MTGSSQKFIARNRAPRVQIEYDVELYGSQKTVQLPFVMGVMSDLAGKSEVKQPSVADRQFLEIDVDNFDDRMKAMAPRAAFSVPNTLTGEGNLSVDLTFEKMDDFTPAAIASKIEPLRVLFEARTQLANLMAYMDGKAGAEALIEKILHDPALLGALSQANGADGATDEALASLRALTPKEEAPKDEAGDVLDALRNAAPVETPAEDQTGDVLATLSQNAPETEVPKDDSADVLADLASAAPKETANEDPAEDVLAGLASSAPEQPEPEDDTALALDSLAGASVPEVAEADTSDDVLAGLASTPVETEDGTDEAADALQSLAAVEVDAAEAPDPSEDILSDLASTAPGPDDTPQDNTQSVLDSLPEVEVSAEEPDQTEDVLSELSAVEIAPDTESEEVETALADLASVDVPQTEESDISDDVLSDLASAAPESDTPADDGTDAALDALAALEVDTPEEVDQTDDVLADIASAEPEAQDESDDTADALDALAALEVAETAEEDGTDDILGDLSADLPDDTSEPDTTDAALDALAALEVDTPEEVDQTDDVLADIASAEPEAQDETDEAADVLASLDTPPETDSVPDDPLSGLDDLDSTDSASGDGLDDLLGDLDSIESDTEEAKDEGDPLAALEDTGDLDDLLGDLDAGEPDGDPEASEHQPPESEAAETAAEEDADESDELDDLLGDLDAGGDLDDLLGDLSDEDAPDDKPDEATVEAEASGDLDDLLGDLDAGDDLDDLLGDLSEEEAPDDKPDEAAVETEASGDLDDLLGDLDAGDDLDDLLGDLDAGDPASDATPEETDAPADELDDLLGDLGDSDDLDDLLGDLDAAAGEESAAEEASAGDDLDELLGDLGKDTPEESTESDELDDLLGDLEDDSSGDDLDDLLGDLGEESAAEPTEEPAQSDDPEFAYGTMSADRPDPQKLNRKRFRIAILGDFTGRAAKGLLETGDALAARKAIQLDVDTAEDVIESFATDLVLPIGKEGAGVAVKLGGLDDLHPDELYENVELFSELNGLRGQLSAGATAENAARQLKEWGEKHGRPVSPPKAKSAGNAVPADLKLSDFQKLVGDTAGTLSEPSPIEDLIARIVGPHVRTLPDNDMVQAVDLALSSAMRLILHHPEFQSVEAQWRSIDLIARSIETDDTLDVMLYDISAEEIAADLAASDDLSQSGFVRLLTDEPLDEELGRGGYSALLGLYSFEETPPHAELLGRIARVAAHVDAPFVAAMSPAFLDTAMEDRHALVAQAWDTLRAMPEARHLGLTSPRFLLRRPYGAKTEPIYEFDFEEFTMSEGMRGMLWANPVVLVAILLARSFRDNGASMNLGSIMSLGGMPYHYVDDRYGDQVALPCTERNLTLDKIEMATQRRYMAVASVKGRDEVRLTSFQSVGGGELLGPWSSETPPPPSPPDPEPAATEADTGGDDTDLDDLLADFGDDLDIGDDLDLGDDDGGDIDADLAALLEDL